MVSRYESWTGQRDRRLSEDGTEERAIRKVLIKKEEHLLFDMALESAMRMREMYTLTVDQVSLEKETIFLEKTKNGNKRQVPMSSVLKNLLEAHLPTLEGESLFPWWDGVTLETRYLDNLSSKISQRFARRFAEAGCPDLHWHDLRHEATSRIYERTTLSDLEIASITGHSSLGQLKRYANLRGSALAKKLWYSEHRVRYAALVEQERHAVFVLKPPGLELRVRDVPDYLLDPGLHDGSCAVHARRVSDDHRTAVSGRATSGCVVDRISFRVFIPHIFLRALLARVFIGLAAARCPVVPGASHFASRADDQSADLCRAVFAEHTDCASEAEVLVCFVSGHHCFLFLM